MTYGKRKISAGIQGLTRIRDRVEMRRRKVHKRWNVTGDVFFRFNPLKFERDIEMGRTVKKLVSAVKGQLEKKNGVIGRDERT